MTRRPSIPYSDIERQWIKTLCTADRRKTHAEFCKKFNRDDVSLQNYNSLCKREGWLTGRTGVFEKGGVSWNKGKSMPYNANSARTQFKSGQKPHNTKFTGHERIDVDGYVMIQLDKKNPWTGGDSWYVHKHRHLWEEKNGPIPKDKILKCLDGDRKNCDPENWKLLPRGVLPRLNGISGRGYDSAPAEIKPAILATAEIAQKLYDLSK